MNIVLTITKRKAKYAFCIILGLRFYISCIYSSFVEHRCSFAAPIWIYVIMVAYHITVVNIYMAHGCMFISNWCKQTCVISLFVFIQFY